MNRHVLIVSPHFPPVNAPDMQRVRMSLPYFAEAGWNVTVLTVDDPTPTAPIEPELLATIPAQTEVIRAHCISRRWTRWLGVNNVALRSLPFLFLAGCRLLAERRYDVVYFSTTMFIVLPFGRVWRRLYGTPYVIDLQDPWVTDFYHRPGSPPPPGGWKYRLARAQGLLLEGWTMRRAAHLVTVSAAYGRELQQRHRGLDRLPCTELPFGSPDPDLHWVRSRLADRPPILPAGGFRLVFAGAIGPGMLAAVELLLAALARLELPATCHFYGTSYSHAAHPRPATRDLAARHGVEARVHEQPARLPYFAALQVSLEADVNLLLGSSDLAFTPSKILLLLATGRPVLALAPEGSAMIGRLAGLGESCLTFPQAGPDEAAIEAVRRRLVSLYADRHVPARSAAAADCSAQASAARQIALLATAAGAVH